MNRESFSAPGPLAPKASALPLGYGASRLRFVAHTSSQKHFILVTNDVFSTSTFKIHRIIVENLWGVRELLPNTRIIWSDILPRLFYYREVHPGAGRRVANFINTLARRVVYRMDNTHSVCQKGVFPLTNIGLFRLDGLHLSEGAALSYV